MRNCVAFHMLDRQYKHALSGNEIVALHIDSIISIIKHNTIDLNHSDIVVGVQSVWRDGDGCHDTMLSIRCSMQYTAHISQPRSSANLSPIVWRTSRVHCRQRPRHPNYCHNTGRSERRGLATGSLSGAWVGTPNKTLLPVRQCLRIGSTPPITNLIQFRL